MSGKIVAFNISSKGYPEGVVIKTSSGLAQVNYPKHGGHALRRATQLGSIVAMRASETDEGAHPVYCVIDDEAEVSGTVVSLNYSRHGNVNGYHLDDGTFVHFKGDDETKADEFHVGDAIRVEGVQQSSPDIVTLEARTIQRQRAERAPLSVEKLAGEGRTKRTSLSA